MNNQFILTPYVLDQPRSGLESFAESGWQIIKPPLPTGDMQQRMIALFRPLASHVADAVSQGNCPISLAGDCCSAIGVLAGLQQSGIHPTLIWLDAHADFNTWETSPSGFIAGMALAMLVGYGDLTMVKGTGMKILPEENVIATDLRDLDDEEHKNVLNSSMHLLWDMADLLDYDLPDGPLWVHFDTDLLRSEDAPAMNYLAEGGPSLTIVRRVFQHLAQTGRITAVSLSSWNPELDSNGRTGKLIMELLSDLLQK